MHACIFQLWYSGPKLSFERLEDDCRHKRLSFTSSSSISFIWISFLLFSTCVQQLLLFVMLKVNGQKERRERPLTVTDLQPQRWKAAGLVAHLRIAAAAPLHADALCLPDDSCRSHSRAPRSSKQMAQKGPPFIKPLIANWLFEWFGCCCWGFSTEMFGSREAAEAAQRRENVIKGTAVITPQRCY